MLFFVIPILFFFYNSLFSLEIHIPKKLIVNEKKVCLQNLSFLLNNSSIQNTNKNTNKSSCLFEFTDSTDKKFFSQEDIKLFLLSHNIFPDVLSGKGLWIHFETIPNNTNKKNHIIVKKFQNAKLFIENQYFEIYVQVYTLGAGKVGDIIPVKRNKQKMLAKILPNGKLILHNQ